MEIRYASISKIVLTLFAVLGAFAAHADDETVPAETVWGAYGGGPVCDPPDHIFPGPASALGCLVANANVKIEYTGDMTPGGPDQPNTFWFPANVWDNYPVTPKVMRFVAQAAHSAIIPSCLPGYFGPNFNYADNTWSCSIHVIVKDQTLKPCDLCVGNPIFPGTGNKRQEDVDYAGTGISPLVFSRTYNSAPQFGSAWKTNFNRSIVYTVSGSATIATINRPDGSYAFTPSGASWVPDSDVNYKLTGGNGGFTVITPNGDQEIYDSYNQLAYIYNPTSTALKYTLTYGAGTVHLLNKVSDAYGHSLNFTYDGQNRLATMIDPDGKLYQYSYDAAGNLSTVTYPDGKFRQYVYNEPAYTSNTNLPQALTGIIDENGVRFANFGYNNLGLAVLSEHAGGVERYTVSYNSPPMRLSDVYFDVPNHTKYVTRYHQAPSGAVVGDALGASRGYGFTVRNGMVKTTGSTTPCTGQCTPMSQGQAFDANGNVTSKTDFNGNQTTYSYDLARNLETSRTEAYGTSNARTITTQWHATLRLPVLITEQGRTTAFSYTSNGYPLTKTITDTATNSARTWTYTNSSSGQILTVDGPRTDVVDKTIITYYSCTTGSECGQVFTIKDALNHITTFNTYNAHGQPLTITDPNNVVTTLTYDLRQRLASRSMAGELTTFEYWPTGQLKKVTMPDGSYLGYSYDNAHRLTSIVDSVGNHVDYTLDALGNRTAENLYDPSNALTQTRSSVFNSLNQLYQNLTAAGTQSQATTFGYDGNGNPTSVSAPMSRSNTQGYDELNRLKQVTDANLGATQFGYNSLDQLVSVTDPKFLQTTYQYNAQGDLLQQASPDTGVTLNTYDENGNLKTSTDARNLTVTYSYDALNRVTQAVYPDQTITYAYDTAIKGIGELASVTDASGSTSWSYTAAGRINSKTQAMGSVSKTVAYGYNSAGQLSSITTPSGKTITYDYTNNQVTAIQVNGIPVLNSVLYEPFGPTSGWTWGNGTLAVRVYDTDGKITQLDSAGLNTYSYDDAFRITGIADASDSVNSNTYNYDSLDRLTANTKTGMNETFTYDANGNRQSQGGTASSTFANSSTSNKLSSVSGALNRTYLYDNVGNTTSDGARTFTYNNAGRMITATSGGVTTTYTYNALGQRVKKSNSTSTTYFVYDEAGHLQGEYDQAGALIEEIVWLNDTPVASIRFGSCGIAIFYIHTDHLNTPRRITKRSTNQIVWRWDSDAFGATAANENPSGIGTFAFNLRFPGQYFNSETGNHYNHFRHYDPSTGKYLESDPIGLEGGINTYSYTLGNPVLYFDEDGRIIVQMGVGAVFGFGGHVLGQLIYNGWRWNCVNWGDAAIAGVFGAVSGFGAVKAARNLWATMGVGVTSNILQYHATQTYNGKKATMDGVGWSALVGALGSIGGVYRPPSMSFADKLGQSLRRRNLEDEFLGEIGMWSGLRNLADGTIGNIDEPSQFRNSSNCDPCSKPK